MKLFLSTHARIETFFLVAGLAWLGACSSSEDKDTSNPNGNAGSPTSNAGSPNSGGSGGGGNAPSVDENVHGSVVLSLIAPTDTGDGRASLLGRFFDGATPEALPLKLAEEQGDCRLMVPALPFCSEACAPDVCTADDVCTPYPKPQDVGALSVSGLGDALELTPKSSMFIYQPASLAYPPCAGGDPIKVTGAGLALDANCVTPLELSGPDPIPVKSGESVKVEWVAQAGDATRIRIGLDISHHGGKKGEIDCEVADTGSFEIPADLVTKLINLGLAGFPTINVNRVSVGSASGAPNVSLVVTSDVTRAVDTGVESCLDNSACKAPQTCSQAGICSDE